MFGFDDVDSVECVVCLCEPKSTVLLPCRHFVVCSTCFARLQQCPVCRARIASVLQLRQEPAIADHGGNSGG